MKEKQSCYLIHQNNELIVGNELIERRWEICPSGLKSKAVINKKSGQSYETKATEPCFAYEGLTYNKYIPNSYQDFELKSVNEKYVMNSIYSAPFLIAAVHFTDILHGIELITYIIVYENCAAIKTYSEIKSENMPMDEFYNSSRMNFIDILPFYEYGQAESYEFFTRTDYTNELVKASSVQPGFDRGNIIISCEDNGEGIFFLKESPCFTDERPETEGNFLIENGIIKVLGTGIRPEEIDYQDFRRTYASIVGVFYGDKQDGFCALKEYQNTAYAIPKDNTFMVMANPWGDRKCLQNISESFVLKELEVCKTLGITHYMIDDGWQKGKSFKRMNKRENIEPDYWEINKEKFPDGFKRVKDTADKLGITLALWFAPDFNRLYRNCDEQTTLLRNIYETDNIKLFKMDGIKLKNKTAEERVEGIFKTLRNESKGDIYFNLDITADPRSGYFMFLQYGNIFLENRYTDWGNYYPYLTLKNLWDLSPFVQLQRVQAEFLNIKRNPEKYNGSELDPVNYSCEYVFAVTMFANPLAWCEVSSLDNESVEAFSRIISLYKKHREGIFRGHILPIGNRPNGYNFTGFQSHCKDTSSGYIIVYRELSQENTFDFKLHFAKGKRLTVKNLSDDDNTHKTDENGNLHVCLKEKNSFRLFSYIFE